MRKILLFCLLLVNLAPTTVFAQGSYEEILDKIQKKVTLRFEQDLNKLSAIMEELKRRKGIEGQKTLVAFGIPQNPIESADYWITFAHEALAFQKAQKFSSKNNLRYSLKEVAGKIIRAKNEVRKALNYEE